MSPTALSFEAVLHVYRRGVIRRLREVVTEHYPTTWQNELRSTLGTRVDELQNSVTRDAASGHHVNSDLWELLELRDLTVLVDRFFRLLMPRSRPEDKHGVMRRVYFLAEERHVLVHRGETAENEHEPGSTARSPSFECHSQSRLFVRSVCARKRHECMVSSRTS